MPSSRDEFDDEPRVAQPAEPDEEIYIHRRPSTPRRRRGCGGCFGCFVKLIILLLALVVLTALVVWASFAFFPPFGASRTARVLLIGLDEPDPNHPKEPRRSDSIILMAVRLDGRGATMLAVPRDARVTIPGYRGTRKINAAYALGKRELLQRTLEQSSLLNAEMPYYIVFSSATLHAMVDAVGGVEVNVPFNMDYDDKYQNLHIHLEKGTRLLKGEQAVGYVRWRKNNSGEHRAGTDFDRSGRQQEVVKAIAQKLLTAKGVFKVKKVYDVFRTHTQSNLNFRQFVIMGLNFKNVTATEVPGVPAMHGDVSFVECDWPEGKTMWEKAIRE